jgi:hypothetical protein
MDVKVQGSAVVFEGEGTRFEVTFHRTLRLPEDGKVHRLPPSLGAFPIERVDDYKDRVPASWVEHGGVFFPMWQREAMWLSFKGDPTAVKVAAGKVNAVSGKTWSQELVGADTTDSRNPVQDYMVVPQQPWLDGFNVGKAVIKQFVAMPLGMGYTVEAQVTGKEDFGGLQLLIVPPKEGRIPKRPERMLLGDSGGGFKGGGGGMFKGGSSLPGIYSSSEVFGTKSFGSDSPMRSADIRPRGAPTRSRLTKSAEMGLGMGGQMEQKIYPDPYGIDVWDQGKVGRLFVHIVNSEMYEQITGKRPPASPISAATYTQHGYPWFKLYDEGLGDVAASETLQGVQTIGGMDQKKGFEGQQDDSPVDESKNVVALSHDKVRDGTW